jgi:hypothetical protein
MMTGVLIRLITGHAINTKIFKHINVVSQWLEGISKETSSMVKLANDQMNICCPGE